MLEQHTRSVSRRAYLAGAASGAVLLAGCTGGNGDGSSGNGSNSTGATNESNGGGSGSQYHLGFSNFTSSDPFEVVNTQFAKWYAADTGLKLTSAAADGSASQQIKDCQNLLNQGVDGLVVTAGDSNGLARVVENAKKDDVPVFGCDIPINSKDVVMHVAIPEEKYGYNAGKQLAKVMNHKYGKDKQKKVLEIMFDQNNQNAVLRHRSFDKAMKESDNITIEKQIEISGVDASSVETKTTSYLQTTKDIDGVFAPWAAGPIGVLRAFERHGMKHKVGEKNHIPIVNCDATATIIDDIKNGYIDQTADQPLQYYSPVAIYYLKKYLDAGKDTKVLPKIGSKITKNDISIKPQKHAGTQVWKVPRWAPADVTSFTDFNGNDLGYPFFRMAIPTVSKDNADKPYLWGNIMRQISS